MVGSVVSEQLPLCGAHAIHTPTYMCMYIYVYVHINVCTKMCMYIYVCVCTYMGMYIYGRLIVHVYAHSRLITYREM